MGAGSVIFQSRLQRIAKVLCSDLVAGEIKLVVLAKQSEQDPFFSDQAAFHRPA